MYIRAHMLVLCGCAEKVLGHGAIIHGLVNRMKSRDQKAQTPAWPLRAGPWQRSCGPHGTASAGHGGQVAVST